MQTYEEIEAEVRKLAHSMPPSDFGSTRAIQAVTQYVIEKLRQEQSARDALHGVLSEAARLRLNEHVVGYDTDGTPLVKAGPGEML